MRLVKRLLIKWRVGIFTLLIALGIFLNYNIAMRFMKCQSAIAFPTPSPTTTQSYKQQFTTTPTIKVLPATNSIFTVQEIQKLTGGKPQFGHFPYPEGKADKMLVIGSYAQHEHQRFERLAPEAAFALMKLIYAARDDNVWIIPVSGFRHIAAQDKLFKAQIERRGSVEAAAKLSAPPGYSEHATGYAVDITDGRFPKQDVTYDFAKTDAYKWLSIHAKEFGFELSFLENNSQGVSYEPWHWRFVGSPEAAMIFKRARSVADNGAK